MLLAHLLPKLRVPLAIGGGIGSGRQLAGMLAMGADAALMGTRFLTAAEIWAHPGYKARLVAATHDDTTTAMSSIKATWRVLDNETAREIRRMEAESDPAFEDFGAVVRGTYGRDHAYERGDAEKGLLSCSSAVGFAERVEPVEAIVSGIVEGARAEFARLDAMRAAATRGASASAA
ncbi:MAG: nitronate monooxygenase [Pseudomonadota bacterium]|nr:nitronate monooxygenase [Pseudomonadota bacterium]